MSYEKVGNHRFVSLIIDCNFLTINIFKTWNKDSTGPSKPNVDFYFMYSVSALLVDDRRSKFGNSVY